MCRLGLGATPVAVSEESVKRKALGIKIGRKLKKKPPKADDDIQTAVEEGDVCACVTLVGETPPPLCHHYLIM